MNCLHCGDCCKRMSPISQPKPCKHIIEIKSNNQTFTFCKIYENRPEQCKNHEFYATKCPVGCDVLNIRSADEANKRISIGYKIIKKGLRPLEKGEAWWE